MKSKRILRALSLILLQTFIVRELAFAEGLAPLLKEGLAPRPVVHLKFPASVAMIEDAYIADSVERIGDRKSSSTLSPSSYTLYLIQDAHTNESGQYNLAKALSIILDKEKDLKFVFTEAGVGDNSLSFLRNYKSEKEREVIARSYIKKGYLHGAEYLDLTATHDFILWGVEDLALYSKALEDYRQVAKERDRLDFYLKKIGSTTETLKNRLLNPSLATFDKERNQYREEKLPLTSYFNALLREAQLQNVSLLKYTHLELLRNLRDKEAAIDFAKANVEHQKAVSALSPEAQEELKGLADTQNRADKVLQGRKDIQAYFLALQEKLGARSSELGANKYPELSKYFDYLKLAEKVEAKEVLKEIDSLENEILSGLSRTEDEKTLIKCGDILFYLKKLFRFTLTPEEYDVYKDKTRNLSIEALTGFLNKKIMDLETYYERALFLEKGYDEALHRAEAFYEITKDRDEHFLKETLEKLDKENSSKAVLITGGFHTANLKALLKAKGISYVSITPQVWQETNLKKYESVLLGQNMRAPHTALSINSTTIGVLDAITAEKQGMPWPGFRNAFGTSEFKGTGARLAELDPKGTALSLAGAAVVLSGVSITANFSGTAIWTGLSLVAIGFGMAGLGIAPTAAGFLSQRTILRIKRYSAILLAVGLTGFILTAPQLIFRGGSNVSSETLSVWGEGPNGARLAQEENRKHVSQESAGLKATLAQIILEGGAPHLTEKQIPSIVRRVISGELDPGKDVDAVTSDDQVIAPIGRNIAEEYGIRHRTVNVLIRTSKGRFLFPARAPHKKYPYGLGAYGGQVFSREAYDRAKKQTMLRQLGLPDGYMLKGRFTPLGEEGSFKSPVDDEKNVENRSWYIYDAPESELEDLLEYGRNLEQRIKTHTRAKFEKWLADQAKEKPGAGEIYTIVELSLAQVLSLVKKSLGLAYNFTNGIHMVESKPTPDSLALVLKDQKVVNILRKGRAGARLADSAAMTGLKEKILLAIDGFKTGLEVPSVRRIAQALQTTDAIILLAMKDADILDVWVEATDRPVRAKYNELLSGHETVSMNKFALSGKVGLDVLRAIMDRPQNADIKKAVEDDRSDIPEKRLRRSRESGEVPLSPSRDKDIEIVKRVIGVLREAIKISQGSSISVLRPTKSSSSPEDRLKGVEEALLRVINVTSPSGRLMDQKEALLREQRDIFGIAAEVYLPAKDRVAMSDALVQAARELDALYGSIEAKPARWPGSVKKADEILASLQVASRGLNSELSSVLAKDIRSVIADLRFYFKYGELRGYALVDIRERIQGLTKTIGKTHPENSKQFSAVDQRLAEVSKRKSHGARLAVEILNSAVKPDVKLAVIDFSWTLWNPSRVAFMPGAKELLETLERHGIEVWILSLSPSAEIKRRFHDANMEGLYKGIIGKDNGGDSETYKALQVRELARRNGLAGHEVAVVGDSDNDMTAAKTAGVVGVAFVREELYDIYRDVMVDAGADAIVKNFSDPEGLVAYLKGSGARLAAEAKIPLMTRIEYAPDLRWTMAVMQAAYDKYDSKDKTQEPPDQVLEPVVIGDVEDGNVGPDDVAIFVNFRTDRALELTGAFTRVNPDNGSPFTQFPVDTANLPYFMSMAKYADTLNNPVILPPAQLENTMPDVWAKMGLRVLLTSETEKRPHTTFFLKGQKGNKYVTERWEHPASTGGNYAEAPEMRAEEVANIVVDSLDHRKEDVIIFNFANADMVGHTGNFEAAKEAVRFADTQLGRVREAARRNNAILAITADHGNSEEMVDESGEPNAMHTFNRVPFILAFPDGSVKKVVFRERTSDLKNKIDPPSRLADILPTLFNFYGWDIPAEVNGRDLIANREEMPKFDVKKNPLVLGILDGWGLPPETENPRNETNAVLQAHTPVYDGLLSGHSTALYTDGEYVGLPKGVFGNSEIGHNSIGAGRTVPADISRINQAIADGTFFDFPLLKDAADRLRKTAGKLFLMGLLTEAGVHAYQQHWDALLKFAEDNGIPEVRLQLFTDGRDGPTTGGIGLLKGFQAKLDEINARGKTHVRIVRVIGRGIAMDRDRNWDRIQATYHVLTQGKLIPGSLYQITGARLAENDKKEGDILPLVAAAGAGVLLVWSAITFVRGARARAAVKTERRRVLDRAKDEIAKTLSLPEGSSLEADFATMDDLPGIMEAQHFSNAAEDIHQLPEVYAKLIEKRQVVVVRGLGKAPKETVARMRVLGSIVTTSFNQGTVLTHAQAMDPKFNDPAGDSFYVPWIAVDRRFTEVDQVRIADALLKLVTSLAEKSGKVLRAFSRPGNTYDSLSDKEKEHINGFKTTLPEPTTLKKHPDIEAMERVFRADRGKFVTRDILFMRPKRDVKDKLGSTQPFMDWAAKKYGKNGYYKWLERVVNPAFRDSWDPTIDKKFITLLGLLVREFLDEHPDWVPVDPAIGLLHSRKGATMTDILIDGRLDDWMSLYANVIMSYLKHADIHGAIKTQMSDKRYRKPPVGARLADSTGSPHGLPSLPGTARQFAVARFKALIKNLSIEDAPEFIHKINADRRLAEEDRIPLYRAVSEQVVSDFQQRLGNPPPGDSVSNLMGLLDSVDKVYQLMRSLNPYGDLKKMNAAQIMHELIAAREVDFKSSHVRLNHQTQSGVLRELKRFIYSERPSRYVLVSVSAFTDEDANGSKEAKWFAIRDGNIEKIVQHIGSLRTNTFTYAQGIVGGSPIMVIIPLARSTHFGARLAANVQKNGIADVLRPYLQLALSRSEDGKNARQIALVANHPLIKKITLEFMRDGKASPVEWKGTDVRKLEGLINSNTSTDDRETSYLVSLIPADMNASEITFRIESSSRAVIRRQDFDEFVGKAIKQAAVISGLYRKKLERIDSNNLNIDYMDGDGTGGRDSYPMTIVRQPLRVTLHARPEHFPSGGVATAGDIQVSFTPTEISVTQNMASGGFTKKPELDPSKARTAALQEIRPLRGLKWGEDGKVHVLVTKAALDFIQRSGILNAGHLGNKNQKILVFEVASSGARLAAHVSTVQDVVRVLKPHLEDALRRLESRDDAWEIGLVAEGRPVVQKITLRFVRGDKMYDVTGRLNGGIAELEEQILTVLQRETAASYRVSLIEKGDATGKRSEVVAIIESMATSQPLVSASQFKAFVQAALRMPSLNNGIYRRVVRRSGDGGGLLIDYSTPDNIGGYDAYRAEIKRQPSDGSVALQIFSEHAKSGGSVSKGEVTLIFAKSAVRVVTEKSRGFMSAKGTPERTILNSEQMTGTLSKIEWQGDVAVFFLSDPAMEFIRRSGILNPDLLGSKNPAVIFQSADTGARLAEENIKFSYADENAGVVTATALISVQLLGSKTPEPKYHLSYYAPFIVGGLGDLGDVTVQEGITGAGVLKMLKSVLTDVPTVYAGSADQRLKDAVAVLQETYGRRSLLHVSEVLEKHDTANIEHHLWSGSNQGKGNFGGIVSLLSRLGVTGRYGLSEVVFEPLNGLENRFYLGGKDKWAESSKELIASFRQFLISSGVNDPDEAIFELFAYDGHAKVHERKKISSRLISPPVELGPNTSAVSFVRPYVENAFQPPLRGRDFVVEYDLKPGNRMILVQNDARGLEATMKAISKELQDNPLPSYLVSVVERSNRTGTGTETMVRIESASVGARLAQASLDANISLSEPEVEKIKAVIKDLEKASGILMKYDESPKSPTFVKNMIHSISRSITGLNKIVGDRYYSRSKNLKRDISAIGNIYKKIQEEKLAFTSKEDVIRLLQTAETQLDPLIHDAWLSKTVKGGLLVLEARKLFDNLNDPAIVMVATPERKEKQQIFDPSQHSNRLMAVSALSDLLREPDLRNASFLTTLTRNHDGKLQLNATPVFDGSSSRGARLAAHFKQAKITVEEYKRQISDQRRTSITARSESGEEIRIPAKAIRYLRRLPEDIWPGQGDMPDKPEMITAQAYSWHKSFTYPLMGLSSKANQYTNRPPLHPKDKLTVVYNPKVIAGARLAAKNFEDRKTHLMATIVRLRTKVMERNITVGVIAEEDGIEMSQLRSMMKSDEEIVRAIDALYAYRVAQAFEQYQDVLKDNRENFFRRLADLARVDDDHVKRAIFDSKDKTLFNSFESIFNARRLQLQTGGARLAAVLEIYEGYLQESIWTQSAREQLQAAMAALRAAMEETIGKTTGRWDSLNLGPLERAMTVFEEKVKTVGRLELRRLISDLSLDERKVRDRVRLYIPDREDPAGKRQIQVSFLNDRAIEYPSFLYPGTNQQVQNLSGWHYFETALLLKKGPEAVVKSYQQRISGARLSVLDKTLEPQEEKKDFVASKIALNLAYDALDEFRKGNDLFPGAIHIPGGESAPVAMIHRQSAYNAAIAKFNELIKIGELEDFARENIKRVQWNAEKVLNRQDQLEPLYVPVRTAQPESEDAIDRRTLAEAREALKSTNRNVAAPLKAPVKPFLRAVGSRLAAAAGPVRMALMENVAQAQEGAEVTIYSLSRKPDTVIVEYSKEGGVVSREALDISTGKRIELNEAVKGSELVFEEQLTQDVDGLKEANRRRPSYTDAVVTPKKLYLHLDALENLNNKKSLANLLYHFNKRASKGTVIVLAGGEERKKLALDLVRDMSLKNGLFFTEESLSADHKAITYEAHLVTQGAMSADLKMAYPNASWFSLQRTNDVSQMGVFAFAPIESLMELAAVGQVESAFEFFKLLTGYGNITLPEFKLLLQGDADMAARYPITFLKKVDWNEAAKLYQISRAADLAA